MMRWLKLIAALLAAAVLMHLVWPPVERWAWIALAAVVGLGIIRLSVLWAVAASGYDGSYYGSSSPRQQRRAAKNVERMRRRQRRG
ncbi:hypothetical protein [Mycobacterium sp. 155]|uniref:hypothetical protein n=1 Tax=Mycobacterium sp. 155 TaxID=1157943 RepID=UPI00037164F7|nr:hypothetical protein [Mycobacterium sp. 155]